MIFLVQRNPPMITVFGAESKLLLDLSNGKCMALAYQQIVSLLFCSNVAFKKKLLQCWQFARVLDVLQAGIVVGKPFHDLRILQREKIIRGY
jgi:hypothetical protein